jgi:hypothetical protein
MQNFSKIFELEKYLGGFVFDATRIIIQSKDILAETFCSCAISKFTSTSQFCQYLLISLFLIILTDSC